VVWPCSDIESWKFPRSQLMLVASRGSRTYPRRTVSEGGRLEYYLLGPSTVSANWDFLHISAAESFVLRTGHRLRDLTSSDRGRLNMLLLFERTYFAADLLH